MSQDYDGVRTTNSVWYLSLPWMEKFLKKIPTRSYFQQVIRSYCESKGITRLSLGLVAGARASMYFDGEWRSVSFDKITELAQDGTDILFIEKADICEVLTLFAKKYGVALVNTIGFLTEYGRELMKAADESGANIAILTDYEDYGLSIVANVLEHVDIPRIGIDEKTFEYFGLDRERLSIASKRKIKNFSYLDVFEHVDKDFLRRRRVEIDAVLAAVGNERFWEYITDKLVEEYPTRDYNRAIELPAVETLYFKELQELLSFVNEYYSVLISDKEQEIVDELSETSGMIDVDEKGSEIQKQLQEVVDVDDGVKEMNPIVKNLLTELKKKKKDKSQ